MKETCPAQRKSKIQMYKEVTQKKHHVFFQEDSN
jgi:hypothetical protein